VSHSRGIRLGGPFVVVFAAESGFGELDLGRGVLGCGEAGAAFDFLHFEERLG